MVALLNAIPIVLSQGFVIINTIQEMIRAFFAKSQEFVSELFANIQHTMVSQEPRIEERKKNMQSNELA